MTASPRDCGEGQPDTIGERTQEVEFYWRYFKKDGYSRPTTPKPRILDNFGTATLGDLHPHETA